MEPNTRRRRRSGVQNAIGSRQGPQRLNVVAPINVQRNPNTGAAAGIAQALGLFAPIGETLISQSIDKKRDAATAAGLSGAEENPEGSLFDQAFLRARGIRDAQVMIAGLENEINTFIQDQEQLAADNGDIGGATVEDVNAFIEAQFQSLLLNDAGEVDVERFGSEKAVKEMAAQLAGTRGNLLKAAADDIRNLQISRFVRIQSDRLEANLFNAGVFDIEGIFQEAPREFRGPEMKTAFVTEMVNIAVRQGNPEALQEAADARFKDGVKIFDTNQRRTLENGIISANSIKLQQEKAEAAALSNSTQVALLTDIQINNLDVTEAAVAAAQAGIISADTAMGMLRFNKARQSDIEGDAPDFATISNFKFLIEGSTEPPEKLRELVFKAYLQGQFGDPDTKTASTVVDDLLNDIQSRERADGSGPRVQGTLRFQAPFDNIKNEFVPVKSFSGVENRQQASIRNAAVRKFRLLVSDGMDPLEAETKIFEEFGPKFEAALRASPAAPEGSRIDIAEKALGEAEENMKKALEEAEEALKDQQ